MGKVGALGSQQAAVPYGESVVGLVRHPDPLLRKPSVEVTAFDGGLRALVDRMDLALEAARGIGLAAVQVGVPFRVAIVLDEDRRRIVMVNPAVLEASEVLAEREEGCLSIPGIREDVTRPAEVTVTYRDQEGRTHALHARDTLATCIQHEIDHMDGVLFLDRVSRLKRTRAFDRYAKGLRTPRPARFGGPSGPSGERIHDRR